LYRAYELLRKLIIHSLDGSRLEKSGKYADGRIRVS